MPATDASESLSSQEPAEQTQTWERIREVVRQRLRAYQVTVQVAERLTSASEADPTNAKKASAARNAVRKMREAKEQATPEAVAADLGYC